jgi:hypothetical protein
MKSSMLKHHLVGKSIEGNDRTINVHGHLDENIKLITECLLKQEL